MLYAFNLAEETQRAEGGLPLKIMRILIDDLVSPSPAFPSFVLGQCSAFKIIFYRFDFYMLQCWGSYIHKPTYSSSQHERIHEMWAKMPFIKAKFAVYGHEPNICITGIACTTFADNDSNSENLASCMMF